MATRAAKLARQKFEHFRQSCQDAGLSCPVTWERWEGMTPDQRGKLTGDLSKFAEKKLGAAKK